MRRLIDADKLIEELNNMPYIKGRYDKVNANEHFIFGCETVYEIVINILEEQQTAFDVDKVVKELKLLQENARLERKTIANEEVEELCDCDDWYDSGYTTGYLNAQINTFQKAIDIVKEGGIDE